MRLSDVPSERMLTSNDSSGSVLDFDGVQEGSSVAEAVLEGRRSDGKEAVSWGSSREKEGDEGEPKVLAARRVEEGTRKPTVSFGV